MSSGIMGGFDAWDTDPVCRCLDLCTPHLSASRRRRTKIGSIDLSFFSSVASIFLEFFLSSFLCEEWHVCIFPTKFPSSKRNVSQSYSHWQEQLAQREALTKSITYCDEFPLDHWFVVDSLLELSARWSSLLNLSLYRFFVQGIQLDGMLGQLPLYQAGFSMQFPLLSISKHYFSTC